SCWRSGQSSRSATRRVRPGRPPTPRGRRWRRPRSDERSAPGRIAGGPKPESILVIRILFLVIASLALLSALGTVLAPNLVHAALFLVAFFFLIACQFVLLEAEFLAAMQVVVYIGAVAILMMFGIMLTRNIQGDETTTGHWAWKAPAALVGVAVLA